MPIALLTVVLRAATTCRCVCSNAFWASSTRWKSDRPSLYPMLARVKRTLGGRFGRVENPLLLAAAQVRDHIVLYLPHRAEDGVLVVHQELLEPGILDPDVVGDATVIEHVPAEVRPAEEGHRVGTEELADPAVAGPRRVGLVRGHDAEEAGQPEAGIQISFGYAHRRALCRRREFGLANIGTTPQQVGGSARGHGPRRCGNHARLGTENLLDPPGGRPSSVLSALRACCRPVSNGGIDAWVPSSCVRACSTSSSPTSPPRNRASVI